MYTHTCLSQDLTSDQEKLPRNGKHTFTGRRATEEDPSSPGWTEAIDVM